jgi:hypothetical protein
VWGRLITCRRLLIGAKLHGLATRRRMPSCPTKSLIGFLLFALLLFAGGPGFRSHAQLEEHYAKHGAEFGHISLSEYLRLAQELRDAPVGGPILEARRPDGQFSRFDRRRGYFGAYNPGGTIRTFFIPNDGERYFRRQARRAY